MTKTPNTPTPWRITDAKGSLCSYTITAANDTLVLYGAQIVNSNSETKANAALIVRAVNSFEALVNALRAAQAVVDAIADGRPGDVIYDSEDNERLAKQVADALASLEAKR